MIMVITFSEDNQYSSSPYALTCTALTLTRNTQNTRLMSHGFQGVQNWSTSCAAVRSEATEMASLNQ